MLRKGVLSISRGRFLRGAGHLFTGPERSRRGLTHHDEFGLCVSRRVGVTGLGEICGAAVPHHSYRQEADLRAQPAHQGAGWSKDYTPSG